VLVVDDASPDGTGRILNELSQNQKRLRVIHRPKKLGLGTAHKLAMKYAISNEYDVLVTMDADYSHHPKYLPTLVKLMSQNDFVTGSRFISGGGLSYGILRRTLSTTANIMARNVLKIPLKECTTSFRGFKVSLLKKMKLDLIQSEGYSFFVESIFYLIQQTKKINEFPIYFYDRKSGSSKISKIEIFNSVICLGKLFYKKLMPKILAKQTLDGQECSLLCPICISPFQTNIFTMKQKIKIQSDSNSERQFKCLQCGAVFN
jgi:dolichol-phosphate mannosyltransferase